MKFNLVIFDCDGVLVDSEALGCEIIARMATEHGAPMTAADADRLFTGGNWYKTVAYIEEQSGKKVPSDFEEIYRQQSAAIYEENLQAVEGVKEVIESLNCLICVGSNGPRRKIIPNLKFTGLDKYFDEKHIFSAYDINKWKPNPALYLHAANQMGIPAQESLVIDDSLSGVTAGIEAGMTVMAYSAHGQDQKFAQSGAHILNRMSDFYDLLERLA